MTKVEKSATQVAHSINSDMKPKIIKLDTTTGQAKATYSPLNKKSLKEIITPPQAEEQSFFYATGKRKNAIAKVWVMKDGNGSILINGKKVTDYFQRSTYRMLIEQPLKLLKIDDTSNIECQVLGGGLSGQAGAISHGISKALKQISEEFHRTLRSAGFLTRDSRQVERKKYGQPKARKKFQFSKR